MTTSNEFEYYLILRNNKFTSPLLSNDDDIDSEGTVFLNRMQKVDTNIAIHLTFNPPVPPKPQMTDYLWLSGGRAVFSKTIFDVLQYFDI
jgi:hypothetical protein